MKRAAQLAMLGVIISCVSAHAEDVNYDSMNDAGFGETAKLLQEMTPEQRTEVLRQAAIKEKDLEKLTPEQREKLQDQLQEEQDTIDMEKVDPAKLDPAKSKSTGDTMSDLNTYQKKYNQGQIKNSVVKSPGASQ